MRKAKIVATIGPATADQTTLEALLSAGTNVFRLNMSHIPRGEYQAAESLFDAARAAILSLRQPAAMLVDLSGPKLRTGKLEGGEPIHLKANQLFTLTARDIVGNDKEVSVNYPEIIFHTKPGARVLFEDGAIELTVEQVTERELICRVLNDGDLGERKGINLPGVTLPIASLTDKDKEDLAWAARKGADFIALSFVQTSEDCLHAKELIQKSGSHAKLVAKIEMAEAIRNIDSIIEAADAIMVARGDLGVETSVEMVPVYQKMIIEKANVAGRPVITATQMLQSMVHSPRPTRAEASDVANAVWDGSDAVMLSNETAVGEHPVVVVATMARIIEEAEIGRPIATPGRDQRDSHQQDSFLRAISAASLLAAEESRAEIIAVFTESGQMARSLAMLRPRQRVVALTMSPVTQNQLALSWGTETIIHAPCKTTKELIQAGEQALLENGMARDGEQIVMLAGRLSGLGLSSSIKLHTLGEKITDPDSSPATRA